MTARMTAEVESEPAITLDSVQAVTHLSKAKKQC